MKAEKVEENTREQSKDEVIKSHSNIKFLFLFKIKPSDKAFKSIPLKHASLLLTFLCSLFPFFQIIFDYKYTKYSCVVCPLFNICLCGALNVLSFIYFLKSYKKPDDCQNAYKGNLAIAWSFITHILLFLIDIFFGLSFFPIDLFFIFDNEYKFISFVLPGLLFLALEFYTAWICYSYTKHILDNIDLLIKEGSKSFNNNKDNENNIELSEKSNISS